MGNVAIDWAERQFPHQFLEAVQRQPLEVQRVIIVTSGSVWREALMNTRTQIDPDFDPIPLFFSVNRTSNPQSANVLIDFGILSHSWRYYWTAKPQNTIY